MKLEFKKIVHHLPYGLSYMNPVHNTVGYFDNSCFDDGWELIYDVKPILRPLSDLTKEIEVNGERFVPIERLFEMVARNKKPEYQKYYYIDSLNYLECSHPGTAETLTLIKYDVMKNQAHLVEKLFEWHFDIHGLIDAGLAIDINTLK